MATMKRPARMTEAKAQSVAEKWNATHPKGTVVRYWRGVKDGAPSGVGPTRTEASVESQTPVVFIEGCSGYMALTHVEPASQGEVEQWQRQKLARLEDDGEG